MISLQGLLQNRSHRDLELIARSHGLPFSRRDAKSVGLQHLSYRLHHGAYIRAIKRLNPNDTKALQALVAVGGAMDELIFTRQFGVIRPYRSWHKTFGKTKDNPRHPWRYPATIAEKLYQLGMIHQDDDGQIELVREVAMELPPLPEHRLPIIKTQYAQASMILTGRSSLLRDIAILLAVLNRTKAKALQGRWLSLSVLYEINEGLYQHEALEKVRSELQTGRLRWLHYLAQVTGLLDVSEGRWFITPLAWDWLNAPPQLRWDMLWHSVEHDLLQTSRLWDQFRFPTIDHYSALVLRHLVNSSALHQQLKIKEILAMADPYILEIQPYNLALFIREMLTWSGMGSYQQGQIVGLPRHLSPYMPSHLHSSWLDRGIIIELSDNPYPLALTRLISFATINESSIQHIDDHTHQAKFYVYIDPATIQTALQQGYDFASVLNILLDITHTSIPDEVIDLLAEWFRRAKHMTLKPLLVLSSTDDHDIESIHRDWRLREHMAEKLSSNHIAIHPDKAHDFIRRLYRRNHAITSFLPSNIETPITETLNPHMIDYMLLAVRSYQKLTQHYPSTITIPSALSDWLHHHTTNPAHIEASAEAFIQNIQSAIPSRLTPPDAIQDKTTVERQVRLAHHHHKRISITYYSPYSDETTTRTININEIYESNDLTYIDAFCFYDEDQRTFRLDRIQRVNEAESDDGRIDYAS